MFRYSDINFELLGEIVQRVSGDPLELFANHEVFQPLGMIDTSFRSVEGQPPAGRRYDQLIAPSEQTPEGMLRGTVPSP